MFNGSAHESRQDNCRGDVRATDLQNCEKPYQRLIRNRYNLELDHEYGDLRLSVLQSVGNREGQTRVNEKRTADSIQLESRTKPDSNSVDCSESDYQTIGAVTADANSSYTHPAHRRVCVIVVVAVVCLMLAGSIVAGIIIAKQSLARASNTETSVHCSTNGSEKEKPNCIIPGSISFSELEYGFNFGEDGILICRVDHYPQWQHVRIIKETPDANLTVFDITNETGVIESSSFIQNASYKLHNDGLTIELKLNPVNCSDEGTYYGLLIVGDIVNDVVANTTVHIKAELSSPQIVVPEQILVSREFVVTCTGYVGRNSNGTYGLISLEKRTNGNGDFTTEGVGNDSARCDGMTFVTTYVTTNRTVCNLGFRCKIEGPNGITMHSDVIYRIVINSFTTVAQNATVITTAAPGASAAANATGPETGGSGSSSYTTVARNATVITTAAPVAPATANATRPGTGGSGSSSYTTVAQNATVITTAAPGAPATANATTPGTDGSGSSSYTTVAQNATEITTAAPGAPATANSTGPGTDGSGSSSYTTVAQNATVITTAALGAPSIANATGPGTGGYGSSSYANATMRNTSPCTSFSPLTVLIMIGFGAIANSIRSWYDVQQTV